MEVNITNHLDMDRWTNCCIDCLRIGASWFMKLVPLITRRTDLCLTRDGPGHVNLFLGRSPDITATWWYLTMINNVAISHKADRDHNQMYGTCDWEQHTARHSTSISYLALLQTRMSTEKSRARVSLPIGCSHLMIIRICTQAQIGWRCRGSKRRDCPSM
jgi:hypothetical protein